MSTAILSNGTSYYIPQSDLSFFTELAERMKWQIVSKVKKTDRTAKLNQAMALMDTMMVKGGTPVPADADQGGPQTPGTQITVGPFPAN